MQASANRTAHLLRSTVIVMLIIAMNKLTGLVKLLLTTRIFGLSSDADAYAAANQLPELFFALLSGGALTAALIPVYSAYLTAREPTNARKLANTILTATMLILGSICGLGALFAPWLAQTILVPDFSSEQQLLTANLMRIALLTGLVYAVANVFVGQLHAHQHFLTPALGTVMFDLGQILGLYFLAPTQGIYGLAWGSLMGGSLAFVVLIPALVIYRLGYQPQIVLHLAGVWEFVQLMGPRLVTLGAQQAVDVVFIRLASQLPEGGISAYFYALLLMIGMPKEFFGTAISQVIFPTLAEQYNTNDKASLLQITSQALRASWILVIPSAIGFLMLGQPAVALLLQRGSFNAEATTLVYSLMGILAIRLFSESSQLILALPFYAHHNTSFPMWSMLGWMVLNMGLSYILVTPFGIHGLTWATSIAALALMITLYYLGRWKIGPLDETLLGRALLRSLLASLGLALFIMVLRQFPLAPISFLVIAISSGIVVYLGLYFLLGGSELLTFWSVVKSHLT